MTKLMKDVLLRGAVALLVAGWLILMWSLPKAQHVTEPHDVHRSRRDVHGKYRYSLESCSKDARGMVYFALGRMVIRQPAENLAYIPGDITDDPTLPQPPDPAEPKGCPDHPLQIAIGGYSLKRISAMPWEERNPASEYADHIGVILNNGGAGITTYDRLFDLLKSHATAPGDPVPGFDVSGNNPSKTDYLVYRAHSYFIPDGRQFTVECYERLRLPVGSIVQCQYSYGVDKSYEINATFVTRLIYLDDSPKFEKHTREFTARFIGSLIPLHEIIAVNREIVRRFEAAQVPDYLWKEPIPATNGGSK